MENQESRSAPSTVYELVELCTEEKLPTLDAVSDIVGVRILPLLRKEWDAVDAYIVKRNAYNQSVEATIRKILEDVDAISARASRQLHKTCVVRKMSSYPQLNLTQESDLDLGLLVPDLDEVAEQVLHRALTDDGFRYLETINPNNPKNSYHIYERSVVHAGITIDVEVKLRDFQATQIVVAIHEYLESSIEEDTLDLLTYGKYLMKHQQVNVEKRKELYHRFKMLLYMYATANVKDAFVLDIEERTRLARLTDVDQREE